MTKIWLLAFYASTAVIFHAEAQTNLTPWAFSILAGGRNGTNNGAGTNASFDGPHGVTLDSATNIYVGEFSSGLLRKISPSGVVTTLASGFGANNAVGVCVDSSNNVYVACPLTDIVYKVTQTGSKSVFASGFTGLNALAIDGSNNIFVTEFGNEAIYEITPGGVANLVAGSPGNAGSADGTNQAARFNRPWGVAVDSAENLYISDSTNCTVRLISPSGTNWLVTTIAGQAGKTGHADGLGTNTLFNAPTGITVDSAGNVYVCDRLNQCVRKLTRWGNEWLVSTVGNVISTPSVTGFVGPRGIVVDGANNLYIAAPETDTIQKAFPALAIYTFPPNFGFAGSQFGFDFGGPPGQLAAIDTTTDLLSWAPLMTNSISAASNHFTDSIDATGQNRFYRLRIP